MGSVSVGEGCILHPKCNILAEVRGEDGREGEGREEEDERRVGKGVRREDL